MRATAAPELSVIIPVWNGALYLNDAVESVLAQEVPSLEIVVVDDGSDDDSAAIAERYAAPVRCIRMPHAGLASARNRGLRSARGEFLMHLDADDMLPPQSIATRMREFVANPDAHMVVGYMESFFSPDAAPDLISRVGTLPPPQRGGLPGASIVRASFAQRVGYFNEDLPQSPDLDWMMRAQEHDAQVVVVQDIVLRRRIHGNNLSLRSAGAAARLRILKAGLDRRRQDEARDAR